MNRYVFGICALSLVTSACVSMKERVASFSHLSCNQLGTALAYEQSDRRKARREGALNGVASILAKGEDSDLLSLDSDISYLDADNADGNIEAIRLEQERRC